MARRMLSSVKCDSTPSDLVDLFLRAHELFSLGEAKLARHGTVSNIMLHVETNDTHRLDDALSKIELQVKAAQAHQQASTSSNAVRPGWASPRK